MPDTSIYGGMIRTLSELSAQYSSMPMDAVMRAYDRAAGNPYIQNRRIKQINTLPGDYTHDQVAEAIRDPGGNELMLRQVHQGLEATAYPMTKIRKVYTDILTYRFYTAPAGVRREDAKSQAFRREAELLDKLADSIGPRETAHKIAGQAIQNGKAFYTLRYKIDKSHNQVQYAFLQQLPTDWVKIVGVNNISGYTVSFNLFYFLQPGTDWRQFGDLIKPYLSDFNAVLEPGPGVVFSEKKERWTVNLERFRHISIDRPGNPDAYVQNGRWAYWVTLPPERVWTFEIDDTNANAVSPMTGLYLSMLAISQYEQVQLELVQNPLVAVMTGEIPYQNSGLNAGVGGADQEDRYMLSMGGRVMFETLWNRLMMENNTGGIGLYLAPANNLKLHQLSEAPGATEISTNGYGYAVEKSGLSGLIPITNEPRAGTVNISVKLEAQYCQRIYQQFERMMNWLYRSLRLRYRWKFHMFGNIYEDEKMRAEMQKSMAFGLLPDLYLYNALMDRSLEDDLSMSAAVMASGVLDTRLPLITSYTAKQGEGNLPPQAPATGPLEDRGGRPSIGIEDVQADGTEDAIDAS